MSDSGRGGDCQYWDKVKSSGLKECGCYVLETCDCESKEGRSMDKKTGCEIKIIPKDSKAIYCAAYVAKWLNMTLGEIEKADDGYYVFYPKISNGGYWDQGVLRAIVNKLEEMNAEWDTQIQSMEDSYGSKE